MARPTSPFSVALWGLVLVALGLIVADWLWPRAPDTVPPVAAPPAIAQPALQSLDQPEPTADAAPAPLPRPAGAAVLLKPDGTPYQD